MNLGSYLRSQEDEEERGRLACIEEAIANGYSMEQSQNCDDGVLNCKKCPFRVPSEKERGVRN